MARMYVRDEENFLFIISIDGEFHKKHMLFDYLNNPIKLLPYTQCIYKKNDDYNLEDAIISIKIARMEEDHPVYIIKNNCVYTINNSGIMEKTDRYIELMPFNEEEFVKKYTERKS